MRPSGFDVDADSLIHISRPKDGFDRLAPISMGRYGPTVGVPRIVETYRRLGLKPDLQILIGRSGGHPRRQQRP